MSFDFGTKLFSSYAKTRHNVAKTTLCYVLAQPIAIFAAY